MIDAALHCRVDLCEENSGNSSGTSDNHGAAERAGGTLVHEG